MNWLWAWLCGGARKFDDTQPHEQWDAAFPSVDPDVRCPDTQPSIPGALEHDPERRT